MDRIKQDSKLIQSLGGAKAVALLLGYPIKGGHQKVNNWITRGIPYKVKSEYPHLFLKKTTKGTSK